MQERPIIEYGTREAPRGKWLALRVVLAILTLVLCVYFGFNAMDTRMFARKWKEYGNDPALQGFFDASARAWTVQAAVVWSIATVGWSSYFIVRGGSKRDKQGQA